MSNLFVDKLLGPKASHLKGGDAERRSSSSTDKPVDVDAAVDKILSKQKELGTAPPVMGDDKLEQNAKVDPLPVTNEPISSLTSPDKPETAKPSSVGFGIFSRLTGQKEPSKTTTAPAPSQQPIEPRSVDAKPTVPLATSGAVVGAAVTIPSIPNAPPAANSAPSLSPNKIEKQTSPVLPGDLQPATPQKASIAPPPVRPAVAGGGTPARTPVSSVAVPVVPGGALSSVPTARAVAETPKMSTIPAVAASPPTTGKLLTTQTLLTEPVERPDAAPRKSRAAELIAQKKAEISSGEAGPKKARRPTEMAPTGASMTAASRIGSFRTNLVNHEVEALIENAGNLLTGPGGPLERRPEQREIMALFENGLLLISKFHIDDPHTTSFIGLLRRKGMTIDVVASDLGVISKCYDERDEGNADGIMRADDETTSMQRDIIRFVGECARLKASDAHVVVDATSTRVRLRVDGILRDYMEWRSAYGSDFCAAAFAMADASDASYQPYEYQAARISDSSVRLPAGVQALRLQFNPLSYGGRHLVMRFLYRSSGNVGDVDTLGYAQKQIHHIKRIRATPMGINIVAGPTGSGKSTTLQRILVTLMRERKNEISVFTVEDPPEYVIAGAQQMPVTNASTAEERKEKFNAAIRAALRSDPDVIMIGEIRDHESAKLAFEAAMTGHQVWATLHAVDCLTIISRLKDIGVDEYKLFDPAVFTGLIGQRLLRALCNNCKIPIMKARDEGEIKDDLWERIIAVFGRDLDGIYHQGKGCSTCGGSGCKGRSVVAEVLLPDDGFMELARAENKVGARRYWLDQLNGLSMLGHGIMKVAAGEVSPEEVERMLGLLELDRVRKPE